MSATETWACPTCSTSISTPFCASCGERQPHPNELTLKGLLTQAFDAFTSYDARLLLTLRRLLGSPGMLSLMYLQGSRKPYIGPFALFLLANVLFVGMEAVTGSNIFATPLAEQITSQPWDSYAQEWVASRLDTLGTTMEAYAPLYDRAIANHAQSFIILMVLPFAFLPALIFANKRLPFAAHMAFSLHFHTFMLVLLSAALALIWLDVQLGGPGLASQWLDNAMAVTSLLVCAVYMYSAVEAVYEAQNLERLGKSLLLTLSMVGVFFGYRFALFVLTLYTA